MTPLDATIATHRALYRDELALSRVVTASPPILRDPNTGEVKQIEGERWGGGMYLTSDMHRILGHPAGLGTRFPWRGAFWRLRYHCRSKHQFHAGADRPYWRGSLCQEAVRLVIIGPEKRIAWLPDGPLSLQNTAEILHYDNPEPVLRQSFEFIEATLDDFRARAERRAREDAGHGPGAVPDAVPEHHVPSEEHIRECPNPVCRARRAA